MSAKLDSIGFSGIFYIGRYFAYSGISLHVLALKGSTSSSKYMFYYATSLAISAWAESNEACA